MIAGQPQTAPSGRRLLRAPGTAVDRAVRFACEALERRRLFAVTIANNSFENPRESSYQYDPPATNSGHGPPGASWTITGNAGIFLYNGSGFVSPQPPDGAQAAFLQSSYGSVTSTLGNISQSITFPSAGTYSVSFYAIARNTTTSGEKPVLPLVIEIDGTQIGSTVSPTSYTTWTQYTSATFTVSTAASQHTLTFTGVNNASVDEDTYIDDVAINAVANTPTVTTGAAATPSPVNGASTNLTVAATDPNNEALTYTWSTTGTPPASVSFSSSNGTSTGNSTTATFSAAGTYNFLVTITDTGGASTTSSVAVTVNQTLTSIAVTPTAKQIVEGYTQQFAASALDQFGTVMATQPSFTWSKSGVGSINSTGLYTAPASSTGTATITATAGGITSNSAAVTVVAETAPTVATAAAANPSPVTGTTTALSVLGSDLEGESVLTYTWSLTGTVPAPVTFSANGTNAAKNTTATFTAVGTYNFLVTLTNTAGYSTTSSVAVVVSQGTTSISITPGSAALATSATQQFSAIAYDQFGNALATQPTFTWSAASGAGTSGSTAIGAINASTGLFTASTTTGTGTVSATAGGVFATAQVSAGGATIANGTVTLATFGTNGYYTADTNSCAIATDNVWTDAASGFQFAGFYTTAGEIMIARRPVGGPSWQVFDSGINDNGSTGDDHDVISIAIDSAGYLHMSWGMHNIPLNYAISNNVVNSPSLTAITVTTQTSTTAPSLFALATNDTGGLTSDTNEVTYPQFYQIPNSPKLLFVYRNGGAGGGSGNGDEYIDVYTPSSKSWTHTLFINGELTSVNAYLNRLTYDSNGNLIATWTWRATSNWQTNSNIMYAQSPDNGITWYTQGGVNKYTLPIIQTDGTYSTYTAADPSVAQVVETIPENSSFINQGAMTVDNNNNPIVASYMAPGTSSDNYNLEYMVWYYYNGQWNSSQVTNRTSDTSYDSGGSDVRDLGRPIVLVDKDGRVLVVTRSEDTSMGSYASPSTPNNDIVVYYTTTASLDSGNATWKSLTLNTINLGEYEPTYDQNLWASNNELSLFFEPVGLSGQTSGTTQTLDWNEQAYFDGTAPTVATAASASPSPVTGTSTKLSVLGADNAGQASLTYTWSLTGTPPALVTLTNNGTNAAQNTTATFSKAGTYNFLATISDAGGLTTTSPITVVVAQTPTGITISPPTAGTQIIGSTKQFTAAVTDQFGNPIASPTLTWSATGGTVNSSGLFTAGQTTGAFSVTAQAAAVFATSTGTLTLPAWLGTGSIATWNPSTGVLAVTGHASIIADPGTDEPIIEATGGKAVVTLDPTSGIDIHLGGLSLTSGASAIVTSLGAARSLTNYHLLIVGIAGASAAPLYTIDATSTLDLADNDMAILYGNGTSPLPSVETQLSAAYDNGAWDKPGLTSSIAKTKPTEMALGYAEASALGDTTFDGLALGGNAVLIKYTLLGDTTLSGSVGLGDLDTVLGNFNASNTTWTQGNFHYGGSVGLADLDDVEANFNASAFSNLAQSDLATTSTATAATSADTATAVTTTTPASTPPKSTTVKTNPAKITPVKTGSPSKKAPVAPVATKSNVAKSTNHAKSASSHKINERNVW